MVLTILSTIARFSLKKPKTVALLVASLAVGSFLIHYNLLVGERDKLRVAEAGFKRAITAFTQREAVLREDVRLATVANEILTAERNSDILALSTLRAGRESDSEARSWGRQALPISEISRLCETLPEMAGCQSTVLSN